ncbi:MHC class II transactivator isoform X2 [Antennarius striatus]|uniref:MHC class II transactivator isoform X2 n=1 Tax=Antennarius striatus TaxID=241820 RepID=UPI0035AEACBB
MNEYSSISSGLSPVLQVTDEHDMHCGLFPAQANVHRSSLRLDYQMKTKAASTQMPENESEGINEGNSEEEEWLEQVFKGMPVCSWQHWDMDWEVKQPLVTDLTADRAKTKITATACKAGCSFLNMEDNSELTAACRSLELVSRKLNYTEMMVPNFTQVTEEVFETPEDLNFSPCKTTRLIADPFRVSGAESDASTPSTTHNDSATGLLNADLQDIDTAEDLFCLTGQVKCGSQGFTNDILHSFSSCDIKDIEDNAEQGLEDEFRMMCSSDGKTDKEWMGSHCDSKMQEANQDPYIGQDLGDLPDDIPEYVDEDCLEKIADLLLGDSLLSCEEELKICNYFSECFNKESYLDKLADTDVLFGESLLNCEDEVKTCSTVGDMSLPGEQTDQLTGRADTSGKRSGDPCSLQCNDDNTRSWPKRQRPAGTDTGSESNPTEMAELSTVPPGILHLHPSIQFITIPDTPGNHPMIRFPLFSAVPPSTYILFPAVAPLCKSQMPPLSPVDRVAVSAQMSSSPLGSSSPPASPLSPNNEISICKESLCPQIPTVPNDTPVVKDYIQKAKTHMNKTCPDIEAGLDLISHYVDVHLFQREIFCSRKNKNKSLDKELKDLFIAEDSYQQKNKLNVSQIFECSRGGKPKHYILLLGNAAMGKTTLIKKLCYDWSRDCIPKFDFVFVLDSKALTLTEPIFSLQTLLLDLSSFAPPSFAQKAVFTQITASPKRVLIIFDGFDSLREYETLLQIQDKDLIKSLQRDCKAQTYTIKQLYSAILQRVLLPGCTLLLSSRPRGMASQLIRRTDSFLELCGFTLRDIETYLSQYFIDPVLRASALEYLKNCSYLHLLCWNPGLCRLVCMVLEVSKDLRVLPKTLTELFHQVLHLKLERARLTTYIENKPQMEKLVQKPQILNRSRQKRCRKNTRTKSRSWGRTQRANMAKQKKEDEYEVDGLEASSELDGKPMGKTVSRALEREMVSQLCYLAWQGVKANSSILSTGWIISEKLKAFGQRTGLFYSYHVRTGKVPSSGEKKRRESEKRGGKGKSQDPGTQKIHNDDDLILMWANPYLQSYLAGVHLSLSRIVSERTFLQIFAFQSGPRGRRNPQKEELELTQRFVFGILCQNWTELQRLHSYTEPGFRNIVIRRQALVANFLKDLSYGDLSPIQVLQACHYIYEGIPTPTCDGSKDSDAAKLLIQLEQTFPEVLNFHGVPLNTSDVFAVQKILEGHGTQSRSFCLDVEDSGIQISGLKALLGLNNINAYRACIADVITLWEQLEQSGEEELYKKAVSKFKIHPLKATQVCHVENLAKLVNIHLQKTLSNSQSYSFLAEGVPAVKKLHMLELELGPERGPLALPKLWELLPGLHNLRHLDLENNKIGDNGAEELAEVVVSLFYLEVLNLSQNCIGDHGVKKVAAMLGKLPKLHCLSLYSNMISDEGAESLAAVLPHMASLTELDVKYNKLTDVGAQTLGMSLRFCKKMKALRMWNQCIPYGVFERLQQQDNRILCH